MSSFPPWERCSCTPSDQYMTCLTSSFSSFYCPTCHYPGIELCSQGAQDIGRVRVGGEEKDQGEVVAGLDVALVVQVEAWVDLVVGRVDLAWEPDRAAVD